MLLVIDEVDDFLDPDKLVFNICTNTANAFDKPTLDGYYSVCRATHRGEPFEQSASACVPEAAANPEYWRELHAKLGSIHLEVKHARPAWQAP